MSSLALGVPLTMVTVLGLLLNGYILFVVVLTKQVQTANNLLLLHLGIVDSLLCSLFLAFSAPALLRAGSWGSWLSDGGSSSVPCSLHGFLFTLLHPVALWTVCGLNCDRYYAISAPLHYGALVSPRRVALGLGAAWALALLLSLPPLFLVAPYTYNPGLAGCAPDFGYGGEGTAWYSAVYTLLTLLLPSALILGCNIKVLMIARYHRHRIASAIFEVTLSAQVTITHQRNPFAPPTGSVLHGKFRGPRSAVSTVLQLLGSLLVLYFPYYGVILSSSFLRPAVHPHIVTLASTLLTCSPPVNGLLYGVRSKVLRKTFQNYWRKQMSKSEMIQEIQARTPSACGSRRPSLTPLGVILGSTTGARPLQRRLSEVLLDPHKGNTATPSGKPRIQRIASELNWRPSSGMSFGTESNLQTRSHALSCNTLQVPTFEHSDHNGNTADTSGHLTKKFRSIRAAVISSSKKAASIEGATSLCSASGSNGRPATRLTSLSSANLFLQRVFGGGSSSHIYNPCNTKESNQSTAAMQTVLTSSNTTRHRSPRILITRAYSEESGDKSPPTSRTTTSTLPNVGGRKYSTSTTSLLDKKWKKLRYQEQERREEDEQDDDKSEGLSSDSETYQRLGMTSSAGSSLGKTHSSASSSEEDEDSHASSGRLYMSLDGTVEEGVTGGSEGTASETSATSSSQHRTQSSYILSWPTTRKKFNITGAGSNGKLLPIQTLSRTRVQLARSFTDITDTPEFVL